MDPSLTNPDRHNAVTPAVVWVLLVIALALACAVSLAVSLAAISL